MTGYRKLDFIPRLTATEDEDGALLENENTNMEQIDILELSQRVIYNTQHTDNIKEKLVQTMKTLYDKVQKSQEEEE
jgi:hypothetical protein